MTQCSFESTEFNQQMTCWNRVNYFAIEWCATPAGRPTLLLHRCRDHDVVAVEQIPAEGCHTAISLSDGHDGNISDAPLGSQSRGSDPLCSSCGCCQRQRQDTPSHCRRALPSDNRGARVRRAAGLVPATRIKARSCCWLESGVHDTRDADLHGDQASMRWTDLQEHSAHHTSDRAALRLPQVRLHARTRT